MTHAQFRNPRLALRQLANRFVDQMEYETNPYRRQLLADKCIAIIGAEIDAIAITFDKRLHEHDVFKQMKQIVSETSNTAITDVVYLGRLANANSIVGNFHNSEDMLTEARCRAYNTGQCLELVNMLYIEVYVKLWEFEKYPTEELRKQLLMWGRIGLESLEYEDVDTKTLWRRMFILRMVFCLLGIGNRANMIENCPIDEDCLCQARELLSDIDRSWNGIETRRKMFYFVAKARFVELTNNDTECIEYIKAARKLANEGHFEELIFISEYYEKIIQKSGNPPERLASQERCNSRNFVLLKKEADERTHTTEEVGNLAAADEDRNVVLLNIDAEIPFSVQDRFEIYNETISKINATKPLIYKPVPQSEEQNLVMLKSISAPIDIERHSNDSNTKSFSICNHTSQEIPDKSTFTRNFVLLHTSADGSMQPLFDNTVCQSTTSKEIHCAQLPGIMPLRLESSRCTAEQTQNIANNDSLTYKKDVIRQKEGLCHVVHLENVTRGNKDKVQLRKTGDWPSFLPVSCSSFSGKFLQLTDMHTGCTGEGLGFVPTSQFEQVQPSTSRCLESQAVCVERTAPSMTNKDPVLTTDQRLNINFSKLPSVSTYSNNNKTESASDLDLIPPGAYQDLPRYFMMQPDDSTRINRMTEDRSEPSGCSFNTAQVVIEAKQKTNEEYKGEKSVVSTEEPGLEACSFQSDEMFGD